MKRRACIMVLCRYMGACAELYRVAKKAIQLCDVTHIRLLLHVWRKVVDECQISLGYVRGSNIYVRGSLDLRTWSLRLRAQIEKNHHMKVLFPSREGHFSLRWITRNTRDKAKGLCISSERHIGVSWAFDALAPEIEDWTRSDRLHGFIFHPLR